MKKFLTVLLALSVVFTYSFSAVGTAFAATTYDGAAVEKALEEEIDGYKDTLEGLSTRVIASFAYNEDGFATLDNGTKVTKPAVTEAVAAFNKLILEELDNIKSDEATKADQAAYNDTQLDAAKALIKAYLEEYGKKDATYTYTEQTLTAAEDVSSYFVQSDVNYVAATGNAVAGTSYFQIDAGDNTLSGDVSGQGYFELQDTTYVPVTNATMGTTYYKFTSATPNVGDPVTGLYEGNGTGQYVATADTNAQPGKTYYDRTEATAAVAGVDLTTAAGYADALDASGEIEKAEAPLAKTYWENKIEEDYKLSNYAADGSYSYTDLDGNATNNLSAQDAVAAYKADGLKKIADAAKAYAKDKDAAAAITAYEAGYTYVKDAVAAIPTIEDSEDAKDEVAAALKLAINELNAYAVGTYTDAVWSGITTPTGTNTVDLTPVLNEYAGSGIVVQTAGSKSATIFGVEVKDVEKATRAEVQAVKSAYYEALDKTAEAVKKVVEADTSITDKASAVAAVEKYYKNVGTGDQTTFTGTVKDAYGVSDVIAAIEARGNALKKAVHAGEKVYDDTKVDAVVAAATEAAYADMGKGSSVEDYFKDAINKVYNKTYATYDLALNELVILVDSEYDKLMDAIDTAKEKFDGSIVTVGTNATPEADKKYKQNYYADEVNADNENYKTKLYAEIKADAVKALEEAQSYADIDAAMAAADAELAKLMTAADKADVTAARTTYANALDKYAEEVKAIKDTTDYAEATYTAAVTAGKKLINNAVTVDAVKAAYEEAKALFDTMQTDKALEELKEAVETELKNLPLASQVTSADADKIEAARDSYDAYMETIGVSAISTTAKSRLDAAEKALYTLERDALNLEIKALNDKLDAIDDASMDVAVEELLALKGEMTTLAEKANAFNDKMEDKGYGASDSTNLTVNVDDIVKDLSLAEGSVWDAEVYMVEAAIQKVLKNDELNMTDINAVLDAYNALTDRQQYRVDKDTNYAIDIIKGKLISATESLKIVTSTKLYSKSNKIRVNWRIAGGDASAITGYQVWKSTKANSGYKFMGKTTKNYMDNKKELKKGKRYYYKVRAYVDVDGERYFSDWSNKGNRIYK